MECACDGPNFFDMLTLLVFDIMPVVITANIKVYFAHNIISTIALVVVYGCCTLYAIKQKTPFLHGWWKICEYIRRRYWIKELQSNIEAVWNELIIIHYCDSIIVKNAPHFHIPHPSLYCSCCCVCCVIHDLQIMIFL